MEKAAVALLHSAIVQPAMVTAGLGYATAFMVGQAMRPFAIFVDAALSGRRVEVRANAHLRIVI